MVNKNNYELFLYFINQRESVRIKKDAGLPAPWTDDEILQKYKFTNVRRRDDRHTKYVHSVLEKIYKEYSGEERNIIMRNFIYFAIRTSMDGLQTLVSVYNFDFKEFIQAQQDHKKSFRQGAYIVRLQWENYYEWMTDNLDKVNSHNLNDCKYLGGFMINQICVYYRDVYVLFGITLGNQEEMTYYSYGKNLGTGQGLDIIGWDNSVEGVYDLFNVIQKELPEIKFDDINDVSNCLCEFSKYYKAYTGQKARRRVYEK